MLLSALPCAILSTLALHGVSASATVLEGRNVGNQINLAVQKAGNKIAAKLSNDAPGDLLQYQKTNDKKLRSRVHDLREIALTDKGLPADVQAYSTGKLGFSFKFMKGMNGKSGNSKDGTVFTNYGKKDPGNILHETAHCYVIMNGKSPFMKSYSDDKKSEAGQSFFHFLVIPKANVWNGAIFTDDTWIKRSRSAFRGFLAKPNWHSLALKRVAHYIDHAAGGGGAKKAKKGGKAKRDALPARPGKSKKADSGARADPDFKAMAVASKGLKEADFAFAYHIGSDASIGHLHMHAIASSAKLRAQSSSRHDEKDVSPEMLLDEMKLNPIGKHPLWADLALQKAAMNVDGKSAGSALKKEGKKLLGQKRKNHRRDVEAAADLWARDAAAAAGAEWASF